METQEEAMMELRVLKYFLAVAREESITKAAEVLHTTQPNLSRQLNSLEAEVGKKLFDRSNRKITLTEEGMFLRKRAKEIIDLTERTEVELASYGEATSGDVYIGAPETYIMHHISKVMIKMRENYPNIQYHIFSGSTIEVSEQLDKGLLDFAILIEPIDLNKYNYIKLPFHDTWGVIMRRDSPLAKLDVIRPDDIKDKPIFLANQQKDSNVFSGWFGDDFKNLNIIGTFNLITTPAMMVDAGLGYVFTFDKLLNTSGDCNLTFRPLEPNFQTGFYLVWKKYQIFSKPASLFLEEIQRTLINE